MTARRFELHRDDDITGVSGTGVVAEGIAFTDGTVALRWRSEWPTSVVFHDRGVDAVKAIHGHGGATRIVWLDVEGPPAPGIAWDAMWNELIGYVQAAIENPKADDAWEILKLMRELKKRQLAPIGDWIKSNSSPVSDSIKEPTNG
jgi:hypothetical protein